MKMIKLVAVALFATIGVSVVAAEMPKAPDTPSNLPPGLKLKKMTPEERARLKEKFQRKMGGFIENRADMKGSVWYFNSQSVVAESDLKSFAARISEQLKIDVRLVKSPADITPATAAKARSDAAASVAVFLVESDGRPVFLVAPEEKWAIINVKALAADGASKEDVAKRVNREMCRGFAFLTATDAMDQNCLMRPLFSVNDLDNIGSDSLSRETMVRMEMRFPSMGIKPYRVATYRRACQEGWAPKPTNDVQKAIWEEVHTAPTAPIVIKPEPKKGK